MTLTSLQRKLGVSNKVKLQETIVTKNRDELKLLFARTFRINFYNTLLLHVAGQEKNKGNICIKVLKISKLII